MRLFNALSRSKEEFSPLSSPVRMYSCGPTVYHYAHLGNLRSYVFADSLRRALMFFGFAVTHVINITDVGHLTDDADAGEDKMEKGARRENKSVWDIARYYEQAFLQDVNSLNILSPHSWTRATEYITEQIEMIKRIEENGFTYQTSDGIYFDTTKLSEYGELIEGFNPEQLQAGKRVSVGEKRAKTDFALWKFSSPEQKRQMEWDSPWGVGFPGWHIECTAMGCAQFGEVFDIHTGGVDHIPVHHTNEIAQARACSGKNHARFWMHNEFLVDKGGKMSKSKGDFLRLQSIIDEGFHPLDYRYFCLLTHYRKPLSFSFEALSAARSARERLTHKVISLKESSLPGSDMPAERLVFQQRFSQAIADDLNFPEAIGVVFEVLSSTLSDAHKLSLLIEWDGVLGLRLAQAERETAPEHVVSLAKKRDSLRAQKDFSQADALRDEILSHGWVVSDSPDGFVLQRKDD